MPIMHLPLADRKHADFGVWTWHHVLCKAIDDVCELIKAVYVVQVLLPLVGRRAHTGHEAVSQSCWLPDRVVGADAESCLQAIQHRSSTSGLGHFVCPLSRASCQGCAPRA